MKAITSYINDKKKCFPFVVAALVFVIILNSIKPVHCEGTVLDPIADAVCDELNEIVAPFAEKIVDAVTQSFTPGYDLYWLLTNMDEATIARNFSSDGQIHWQEDYDYAGMKGDMAGDRSNPIINAVFSFSQKFGVAIATALVLFMLLLCLLGQSQQIRDTPISLILRYIVCIFLIITSFSITYKGLSMFGTMWEKFVMTTGTEKFAYAHISAVYEVDSASGAVLSILGCAFDFTVHLLGKLLYLILGIFLIWKLFKQFLRLYMECAERYFVLTMMTLFFPAICPSIISNSTSNVLHSYLRMFISQGFLLLANGLFMKIYITGFIASWWTSSLLGYVCALVWVKFACKMDLYMNSLGLNVAQTGGTLLDACGGAMHSIGGAIRTISHLDRMGQNVGNSLMQKGLNMGGDAGRATYEKGLNLSNGIMDRVVNGKASISKNKFSRAVQDIKPLQQDIATMPSRKGQSFDISGDISKYATTATRLGISKEATKAAYAVSNADRSKIESLNCISGTQEPGLGNSTIIQHKFSDGDAIVTSGNNGYGNPSYTEDRTAYDNNKEYYLLSNEEVTNLLGAEANAPTNLGFEHQSYEYSTGEDEDYQTWTLDLKEVSQHPDALMDNTRTLYIRSDGAGISYKKTVTQGNKDE